MWYVNLSIELQKATSMDEFYINYVICESIKVIYPFIEPLVLYKLCDMWIGVWLYNSKCTLHVLYKLCDMWIEREL